jgi:hypothetical protein
MLRNAFELGANRAGQVYEEATTHAVVLPVPEPETYTERDLADAMDLLGRARADGLPPAFLPVPREGA